MSVAPKISVFHEGRDQVGESPLWDASRNALWWADINGKAICRKSVGGAMKTFPLDLMPGALALAEDGTLITAAANGFFALDESSGALNELAGVTSPLPDMRFNDGVVDPAGRFWAGTMHMPGERRPAGVLYAFDGKNVVAKLNGLRTQNGCAISRDGKTFYLADSHPDICTIWAFDFDCDVGELSNRRVFHKPRLGRPDGASVDADGCYWFAALDGHRIVRLDPAGKEMLAIELPVSRPTKPIFGGMDLSTIFVTSMRAGLNAGQLQREPLAGSVFAIETSVRGFAQTRFKRTPARQLAGAGA
ncbi:MAG TPA: SMP-30/gluconolactonase/LRE family protein [Rhizobiaceae bacterium]|nr:SMP-30/gluconolactonase/LRE family protein [Rhizobiaceae bacterium]